MTLYEHYRAENEFKDAFSKDPETEAMKLFVEKIHRYKEEGQEINTKLIKKALMLVLRSTHDLLLEGETTSSAGSD